MRKPERSEHIEYWSLDLRFMSRTAYRAGLCRTIYDDLSLHSLSFTLKTLLVDNFMTTSAREDRTQHREVAGTRRKTTSPCFSATSNRCLTIVRIWVQNGRKNETSRWINQQNIREYEPNKENRFPFIEMISCSAQSERSLQIRVRNSHEMVSLVTYKISINLRRVGQEMAHGAFRRCD